MNIPIKKVLLTILFVIGTITTFIGYELFSKPTLFSIFIENIKILIQASAFEG